MCMNKLLELLGSKKPKPLNSLKKTQTFYKNNV